MKTYSSEEASPKWLRPVYSLVHFPFRKEVIKRKIYLLDHTVTSYNSTGAWRGQKGQSFLTSYYSSWFSEVMLNVISANKSGFTKWNTKLKRKSAQMTHLLQNSAYLNSLVPCLTEFSQRADSNYVKFWVVLLFTVVFEKTTCSVVSFDLIFLLSFDKRHLTWMFLQMMMTLICHVQIIIIISE